MFSEGDLRLGIDIGIRGHLDFAERLQAMGDLENVHFTVGFHPSQTGSISPDQAADSIASLLSHSRVKAVGEIGMDFHWDFGTTDEQSALCIAQIEAANMAGLPVIIHNRQATEPLLRLLLQHPPRAGGIMHCFEGSWEQAAAFLDLGMHISFAGNMTFKRNQEIRETLARIPMDRLLLETDSPYLTPEPKRGRPNHPGRICHIYQRAAGLRGLETAELADQVYRNTTELFAL